MRTGVMCPQDILPVNIQIQIQIVASRIWQKKKKPYKRLCICLFQLVVYGPIYLKQNYILMSACSNNLYRSRDSKELRCTVETSPSGWKMTSRGQGHGR